MSLQSGTLRDGLSQCFAARDAIQCILSDQHWFDIGWQTDSLKWSRHLKYRLAE
jgi:hypothetical protein